MDWIILYIATALWLTLLLDVFLIHELVDMYEGIIICSIVFTIMGIIINLIFNNEDYKYWHQ